MASTAANDHTSSSANSAIFEVNLSYSKSSKRSFHYMAVILLRILAIAFSVASISVMVTSDQNVLIFGVNIPARYSYSSALKFLVGVDAVVCGFSVVSLIFVCVLCRSENQQIKNYYFYIFVHDMVMMVLLSTGCAAATAIGYVGRHGEEKMKWFAVCDYVEKFCNQVSVSVALSYLSFLCFVALTALSAHHLITLPNH